MIGMDADEAIPVSMEQLAEAAGRFFRGADVEDIPAKLWLDCYLHGAQIYLRATFDARFSDASICRLGALAISLGETHGIEIVAVAYPHDVDWSEIEERSRDLQRIL